MPDPTPAPTPYEIHIPVLTEDLDIATRIARMVTRSLAFQPHLDHDATTISARETPDTRHQIFCDLRLPSGRRCLLRPQHDGPCARRLPR